MVLVNTEWNPCSSQVVMPPSTMLIQSVPSWSTINRGTPHFWENSGVLAELYLAKRMPSNRSTLPRKEYRPIDNLPGVCATYQKGFRGDCHRPTAHGTIGRANFRRRGISRWFATGAVAVALAGAVTAQVQPAAPGATPTPGEFKVKYYGQFSELPVGSVQPLGWIEQWLERQAQGLTGHPENMSYPYDTCMYAGAIPPPPYRNKWWTDWWPYEQSGYFVDATTRLSWLINDPGIRQRRDANLNYILTHSSGTNFGGSHWCWPNAVVGRALMAQFSATGDPRVAAVMQNWLLTSADAIAKGGRNGANFEEAFYLYGLTGDPRLLDLCRKIYDGYLHDTNSFCTDRQNSEPGAFPRTRRDGGGRIEMPAADVLLHRRPRRRCVWRSAPIRKFWTTASWPMAASSARNIWSQPRFIPSTKAATSPTGPGASAICSWPRAKRGLPI